MDNILLVSITSLWLGILTSISPCSLATNIAAVSYIGKKSEHKKYILLSGLLYTSGRVLTYVIVASIIVSSLLSTPSISNFLQEHVGKILGPILILTGMILLGLLKINIKSLGLGDNLQRKVDRYGILSALPLGTIFALSFCPISAAIYFGNLIPLSLEHNSRILLPTLYGIGTAIPVIAFACIMAFAAHLVARAFNKIRIIEVWMRKITGTIFILVGIYLSLTNIFRFNI
ncbi:MAG: sulfite exporter TauE/SafE family protein [Deltaproteobacteria bacterium]|jgi:cytochrome c-type biogenesis protein|nr:sulfite exporter TauE/SafE family protein [Deltaproteobacteria bacterium]